MKQIIKNFNNLIKKTIFKVQNKTNNNFKISNFNKYLITLIGSLFIYLFYLLLPLLYDKNWVQNHIENKLLEEFKINISTSSNMQYNILPSPHFLIKDSKILIDDNAKIKSIADIKNLKIFLSQKNFFDKTKISLKKIMINNANFSLLRNDLKLLDDLSDKKFSNKKIKITNSKIFFKDNTEEVISIIKIKSAILLFDDKKSLNLFKLKGETFAIPITFDLISYGESIINKEINLNAKSLKLNILNKSTKKDNQSSNGTNIISLLNSTLDTEYNIKDKLIIFKSDSSKINNSKISYSGKLSINPFDLDLNIDLGNYKKSKILNPNSILIELIKSELLFNQNISSNVSINMKSNERNVIFQNTKISFKIINGKINFDSTRFINNKIGLIELNNSNVFYKENNLTLNTNVLIDIKDSDRLYSFFNTNKFSRKNIRNIKINLDYDFLTNQFKFNNIKIDNNELGDQILIIMNNPKDNKLNNLINTRRLVNEIFDAYEG